MDMTVRPQSKTLSLLYNNSLASLLMQTATIIHLQPIYTGINLSQIHSQHLIPFTTANDVQAKNAFDPALDLSFLLYSQFSSLANYQGSN